MNCSRCGSLDIIKHGFNYSNEHKVQKYKCLQCSSIFSYNQRLPRSHFSSEIVNMCIDLYLKGLSYRVIKRQLEEHHNVQLNHITIYYWLQKYVDIAKNYLAQYQPKLGSVWQMDETFIDFKGRKENTRHIKQSNGYWLWVAIDTSTRFILDMYLAITKSSLDGVRFCSRLANLYTKKPEVIATDGNKAYIYGLKKYFPSTTHIKLKSINLKPNTSFIERFNGTIKNRTKTMRCFESFYPCQNTLNMFKIYYNYLRPHEALNGKTPAQVAGINLDFQERWATLLSNSLLSCQQL